MLRSLVGSEMCIRDRNTPTEPIVKCDRPQDQLLEPRETLPLYSQNSWHQAQVYARENLQPQDQITGAAIIVEPISTVIVEPGWQAQVSDRNYLILERK